MVSTKWFVVFLVYLALFAWLAHLTQGRQRLLDRCAREPKLCRFEFLNPTRLSPMGAAFRPIRSRTGELLWRPLPDPPFLELRVRVQEWMERKFSRFPGILAVERGVWLGRWADLPPELATLYREGGALHLLALSGQHVCILTFMVLTGLRLIIGLVTHRSVRLRQAVPLVWLIRWVPVVIALGLWWISGGLASITRTLAMVLALAILKCLRLHCSGVQWVASSCAIAIGLDPSLISNVGFLLSLVSTALLIHSGFSVYFTTNLLMAIFMWPVTAYFFSKVSLLSPLLSLVLGAVWELGCIPIAFLLPGLVMILPECMSSSVLECLETAWQNLVAIHADFSGLVAVSYVSVLRPEWWEMVVLEGFLLSALASQRQLQTKF